MTRRRPQDAAYLEGGPLHGEVVAIGSPPPREIRWECAPPADLMRFANPGVICHPQVLRYRLADAARLIYRFGGVGDS